MHACDRASASLARPASLSARTRYMNNCMIDCTCVNEMTLYQYWRKLLDSLPVISRVVVDVGVVFMERRREN